jgi:hypothetical protein
MLTEGKALSSAVFRPGILLTEVMRLIVSGPTGSYKLLPTPTGSDANFHLCLRAVAVHQVSSLASLFAGRRPGMWTKLLRLLLLLSDPLDFSLLEFLRSGERDKHGRASLTNHRQHWSARCLGSWGTGPNTAAELSVRNRRRTYGAFSQRLWWLVLRHGLMLVEFLAVAQAESPAIRPGRPAVVIMLVLLPWPAGNFTPFRTRRDG